jgi:hypothetical protein
MLTLALLSIVAVKDQIYLLVGLAVPCVLRVVGEEFRFIALAYAHDAMGEELWPNNEDELHYIILI